MRTIFKVDSMNCQHGKMSRENSLNFLQNITKFSVDLQRKEIVVEGNISPDEVKNAIAAAGYNSVKIKDT